MRWLHLSTTFGILLLGVQELSTVAERERHRRRILRTEGSAARVFTNDDLGRSGPSPSGATGSPAVTRPRASQTRARPTRDLAKEERYWRKQTLQHEREIARLDQRMRTLKARLRSLGATSRARGETRRASRALLEDALDALAADKARLEARFRDRARKGGAFPGWLR